MVPPTVLDGWQQQQPASQDCGCSHKSDAAIIDGEIQQLLGKGVLEETDPTYGQYLWSVWSVTFSSGRKKMVLTD